MDWESIEVSKFLSEFQLLIHKTLQRLNIRQNHMDYDDFFQELQIQLLKLRENFECEGTDMEIERYKFTAYASQGLYWHGLNIIRNQSNKGFISVEENDLQWLEQKSDTSIQLSTSELYLEDFFTQAKKRLSDDDYLLLLYISEDQYTMQEIADLMGLSRETIYQRKKRIQQKLQDIKYCLKD